MLGPQALLKLRWPSSRERQRFVLQIGAMNCGMSQENSATSIERHLSRKKHREGPCVSPDKRAM
jgi:hypothetical protein